MVDFNVNENARYTSDWITNLVEEFGKILTREKLAPEQKLMVFIHVNTLLSSAMHNLMDEIVEEYNK